MSSVSRLTKPNLALRLPYVGRRLGRALLIVADLVLVNLAFVIAYWMRYRLELGREVSEQNFVPLPAYVQVEAGFTLILFLAFLFGGLYRGDRAGLDEVSTIVATTSFGIMLTLAFAFVYQAYGYSRLLFVYAWVLVIVLLTLSRAARQVFVSYLRGHGVGIRRIVVVGAGPLGRMVMHVIATEPGTGYVLAGFVDDNGLDRVGRFKSLGRLDEIGRVVQDGGIDEVIIALPSAMHQRVLSLMGACRRAGVDFRVVPDLYELSLNRVDVGVLRGVPLIGVRDVQLSGFNLLVKRVVDVVLSLLLLLVLSPIWLAIGLVIKLESPGPVLFRQVRLGQGGRPFVAYKFRSMRAGAEAEQSRLAEYNEADGPLFKMKDDPRRTRLGRWLRRTSLDELPQLLNVLRGEMSLVGPRPPLPSEVEQYDEWHRQRLNVAPGVTGLWQVSGRSELPFDEMVMLDLYYMENWSLSLDLKILARTIPAVLSGQGAY